MTETIIETASPPRPDSTLKKLGKSILLLKESRIGMFGGFLVLFWVVIAIIVPLLPLQDPLAITRNAVLKGLFYTDPRQVFHYLGTDNLGRDILSRLLWGSRLVLFWSCAATIVAYAVGMLLGVIAGYKGGWWDEIISFIGNVLLSFPLLVLYLVILTNFGANSQAGLWLKHMLGVGPAVISGVMIIVAVMFGTAPQVARIVRGLVLDLKTRDYIAAAEVRGESPLYIMLVELLPNARGPLIVDACLRLGYVAITIALLGFLGLGLPPPDPDWGKMINEARSWGSMGMNAMLWPAFAISSLVLGLNLLADGIREISLRD